MNRLLTFFKRQNGLCNDSTYDFVLPRLCVKKEDSWKGLVPSLHETDYNPEPPLLSAKFSDCSNNSHILAIANEDGKIALQNTNIKNHDDYEKSLQGYQCHFNAVFDLEWVPGQMKLVSASGDHTACLWDVTESSFKLSRIFNGHMRSVRTAAFRKNDPAVFATGGRDGAILIWDLRASLNCDYMPRADNCIYSGHAGGPGTPISQKKKTRTPKLCSNGTSSSSITGLVFQDDNTLISCGAGDGIIKVWDLRRNYTCYKKEPLPKYSLPYAGSTTFKGYTNLLIDKSGVRLYANCMDNTIYCFNLSSYSANPIQKYTGLRNSTFYIKSCLSPDGHYLISGSSDGKAFIWNINNDLPLVTLNGHTVEVTCVAWSKSGYMPIVTCSDDARHKIWRIGPENINDNEKNLYNGHTEVCYEYKNHFIQNKLKSLEYTPRSLKRLVEKNEKTPNSIEKIPNKRTFSEIDDNNIDLYGTTIKRPHIETKGRRLFSPLRQNIINNINERNQLANIIEENDTDINDLIINHREDSNQENSHNKNETKIKDDNKNNNLTNFLNKFPSPLSEKTDININTDISQRPCTSALFSPTSNLPNYVIDGEAPHLCKMSPKRKLKTKVDWLTNIRKQKLLTTNRITNLNEKINLHTPYENSINNEYLCTDINSTKNNITPKRRPSISSTSSSNNNTPQSKTQSNDRRSNETTILHFFSVSSQKASRTRILQDETNATNLSVP